jgi:aromatic-L-amino-acid/L-tryptophan decarboxylase
VNEPSAECQHGYEEKIRRLELEARPLDPGPKERALLRDKVVAYADSFMERIDGKLAFAVSQGEDGALYDSPISEESTDPDEALNLLDRGVIQSGVNVGSAGHLAYIPGSNLYASALADYLAAVTNRYSGLYFASPGAVRMERILLRWMAGFLGYSAASAGDLTSGGSIANLVGIVTAREAHGLKARDFDRAVVYLGEQTHHAIDKALRIAGLKESLKRFVPLDGRHRMRPEALEAAVEGDAKAGLRPWLIAATAGTTDTGAVDPLADLADVAHRHGLWLYVDGAYGAPFALTEQGKWILRGIERSDSVVLDPHKGLFLPFGSGAVLVREGSNLLGAHHYDASYLQDKDTLSSGDEVSPADLSPELSRPFRALRLWLPLKIAGVAPFRAALEEKLLLARHFHERMAFRYLPRRGDPDDFNRKLISAVQEDGRVFLSSTKIDGRFTLRVAILSLRTHLDTIEQAVDIVRHKAKQLERDG